MERGQVYAPAAISPAKKAPGINWIWAWLGPWAGLDAMKKEKTSLSLPGIEPPAAQFVVRRYTDWATPAPA
jgi:hypothetical protein